MDFEYIASTLLEIEGYAEKARFASAVAENLRSKRALLLQKDRDALTNAVFTILKAILIDIKNAESYKEKYDIFDCESALMDITAFLYPDPSKAPEELYVMVKTVYDVVTRERFLENAIIAAFESGKVDEEATKEIIKLASGIENDEFHRGQLFVGLYEFSKQHDAITEGARKMLSEYTESELKRFSEMSTLPKGAAEILEIVCDVAKSFKTDETAKYITKILSFGVNTINYYAIETLLSLGCEVPQEYIDLLAKSLFHANGIYFTLKRYGKKHLFPQELANEEYLAKSDMVHWLCYPTELGKEPYEIKLLGDCKVKGEKYFIFIYKTDSDNLDEELKNKWLIGWSSDDGGTFSNFDLFEEYDTGKPEKTVKRIKKKLIG